MKTIFLILSTTCFFHSIAGQLAWVPDSAGVGDLNSASLCEASVGGDEIYRLKATGGTPPYIYTILTPEFSAYVDTKYDVATHEEILTLKSGRQFDRESDSFFTVDLLVSDSASPPASAQQTSSLVTIEDANDNPPTFVDLPYTAKLPEYPWSGKSVVTIQADDPDDARAGQVIIRLNDPTNSLELSTSSSPAEVNLQSGTKLDYEDSQILTALIYANDESGGCGSKGTNSANTTIVITILDGPDQEPFFTAAPYFATMDESAPIGTHVKNVTAKDRDFILDWSMSYEIVANGIPATWFAIDPSTGEITVNGTVDREGDSSGINNQGIIQIVVKATEIPEDTFDNSIIKFPYSTNATVSITVNDINDNSPVFYRLTDTSDTSSKIAQNNFNASVDENTANLISIPGLSIYVQDIDADDNAMLELKVLGDESNVFEVVPDTVSGEASLILRVMNSSALDYETVKSFTVEIQATERSTMEKHSATATIVIDINDVNDESPQFENDALTANVFEDAEIGDFITTAKATDKDSGIYKEITYSMTQTNKFEINSTTGDVFVGNASLDRETVNLYFLSVRATDGGGRFTIATLQITVLDVNDMQPEFQRSSYSAIIQEGNLDFTSQLLIYALDDDEGDTDNSKIIYSIIVGDIKDNFTITPDVPTFQKEGEITLKSPLDLESLNTSLLQCSSGAVGIVTLTIMAEDQGTPKLNDTVQVTISIEDINDHTPIFNQTEYVASILEKSKYDTEVIKVFATDGDACAPNNLIDYQVDASDVASINAFFMRTDTINEQRVGILKVRDGNLDRDNNDTYTVKILATDSGGSRKIGKSIVTVTILDINDKPPIFNDSTFLQPTVSENFTVGEVILTIVASDSDSNPNLTYTIDAQSCSDENNIQVTDGCKGQFDMITDPSLQIGNLILVKELDRETIENFRLTLSVDDTNAQGTSQKTSKNLDILIDDVNDNSPQFTQIGSNFEVNEEEDDAVIGEVRAIDIDKGNNGEVTYSVLSEDEKWVKIDASSGQLKTAQGIDREGPVGDWLNITVMATDGGLPPMSNTTKLCIRINDINDNSPEFDQTSYNANVSEDAQKGDFVIRVKASDNDTGVYAEIIYDIIQGDTFEQFSINETSGELTVSNTGVLDREQIQTYTLTIRAQDFSGHGGSHQATVAVHINIMDINDNAPKFTLTQSSVQFREDSKVDDLIIELTATDGDSGENAVIFYSIIDGNTDGHFRIDPGSGAVYLNSSIANDEATYVIEVMAKDGGIKPLNSTRTLTIDVIDVNLNDPEFVNLPTNETVGVKENAQNQFIFHVNATDKDRGENGRISYKLEKGKENFYIDVDNGDITTQNAFDRETQDTYEIIIKIEDKDLISPRSATAPLTITIFDVDDETPYFDGKEQTVEFEEELDPGDIAVSINEAKDNDTAKYSVNYYFIVGGSGSDYFSLNSSSRILTALEKLDREKTSQYDLVIKASKNSDYLNGNVPTDLVWEAVKDDGEDKLHVIVNITDINDNPPVFIKEPYRGDMPFDTQPDNEVIILQVEAKDEDENEFIEYSVTSVNWITNAVPQSSDGTFSIRPSREGNRGDIYLSANSAGDVNGYYEITVEATDGRSDHVDKTLVTIGIIQSAETVVLYSLLTPDEFGLQEEQFIIDLEGILVTSYPNVTVYVDKVLGHQPQPDQIKSDIYLHSKDAKTNKLIPKDNVIDMLNKRESSSFILQYDIVGIESNSEVVVDRTKEYLIGGLIVAGAAFVIIIIIFSVAIYCMRRSHKRKVAVLEASELAANETSKIKEGMKMQEVPNTNQFGGSKNPLYVANEEGAIDIDGWLRTQESNDDEDGIDDNVVDGHDSAIGVETNEQSYADNKEEQNLEDQFEIDFPETFPEDNAMLAAALNAANRRRGAENLTFLFDQGNDMGNTAL